MTELTIFGGTFNPVHTRELMIAQCALEQFNLPIVTFMPNGTPPHKKTDLLDRESRFEMVAAGVSGNPRFEASRLEVDRPGKTWTIDTLKELRSLHGESARINFIVGEDVISTLERYERREEFFQVCNRLLVSPRDTVRPNMLNEMRKRLPEATIELIDCPPDGRSSTLIRNWIRAGKSVRYLVPPAVHDILMTKGHYKQAPQPASAPPPSTQEAVVEGVSSPTTAQSDASQVEAPVPDQPQLAEAKPVGQAA